MDHSRLVSLRRFWTRLEVGVLLRRVRELPAAALEPLQQRLRTQGIQMPMDERAPVPGDDAGEGRVNIGLDVGLERRLTAGAGVEALHVVIERGATSGLRAQLRIDVQPQELRGIVEINVAAAHRPRRRRVVQDLRGDRSIRERPPAVPGLDVVEARQACEHLAIALRRDESGAHRQHGAPELRHALVYPQERAVHRAAGSPGLRARRGGGTCRSSCARIRARAAPRPPRAAAHPRGSSHPCDRRSTHGARGRNAPRDPRASGSRCSDGTCACRTACPPAPRGARSRRQSHPARQAPPRCPPPGQSCVSAAARARTRPDRCAGRSVPSAAGSR